MRNASRSNPYTSRATEFVATLRLAEIPADVRAHARWDILDTLGCAIFGQSLPIAQTLERALRPGAGTGVVPVWASHWRTSPDVAALINGTLVHSFELDDLHAEAIIHPGGVTLPAVLAAGALGGARGADVLAAHIAGLELSTRVGMAAGLSMLSRGWHNNGVLGALGAAAGTARVLRLEPSRAVHALGIAGSLAAGLMAAQYGSMVKRLHAGHAAQTGVRAGLLAREGFTGIEGLFEETYGGYLAAFAGECDAEPIVADLGSRWETLRVGFKPYAACGSSHTTIDVLLQLRQKHAITAEQVESVQVASSTVTKDHVGWEYHPDSVTTAQMNLSYAAAVALIFGRVSVAEFDSVLLDRDDICDLAARTTVTADPAIDQGGRAHRHEVRLQVTLRDGRVLTGHRVSATGSHAHPMSESDRTEKFFGLTERGIGAEAARRVFDAVMGLEEAADLTELTESLTGVGQRRGAGVG